MKEITLCSPKVRLICNAMSEVRQYMTSGKDQSMDVIIAHIQYQFNLEREEAETVVNHLLTIAASK